VWTVTDRRRKFALNHSAPHTPTERPQPVSHRPSERRAWVAAQAAAGSVGTKPFRAKR